MKNYSNNIDIKFSGRDIICVSSMPYNGMWTRKQRLMTILAEMGNRVLYVEPVEPLLGSSGNTGSLRTSFQKARENLYILTPAGRLPLARISPILKMNFNRYVKVIRKTALKLKFENPILFTYTPVIHAHSPFIDICRYFKESPLIYDCVDEHSETIGYVPGAADIVHQLDLELTRKADLVFVTAKGLYEDRKTLNNNIHFSPNGVDVGHFSKALLPETKLPDDIKAIPEPRIGFMGALSKWIDLELIEKIARYFKNCSIVIIGPAEPDPRIDQLKQMGNVYFLGKKRLEELPGYLKAFKCGINPFRRIGISEKVNPLKVYEYLAAGLPVISTDMPEIMRLKGVVYLAQNDEQFINAVEQAVNNELRPDSLMLNKILSEHNWDTIFSRVVKEMSKILD